MTPVSTSYQSMSSFEAVPSQTIRHNNQTTVFMIYELQRKFCLLHDNRIFHFRKEIDSGEVNAAPRTLRSQDAIDCLNDLVTTSKYRAIFGLYFPLRFIDYAVLIYFSYALLTTEYHMNKIPLYTIVALEIVYDVMESVTKLWPMERTKFFVAVTFYGLYFSQFIYIFLPFESYRLYWILLIGRFVAFVLELGLDIALDTEIHNDIQGFPAETEWFSIARTEELKKLERHYIGSCSSLLFAPVKEDPKNKYYQYRAQRWIFLGGVIVIVWLLVLPLVVFALVGGGICYLVAKLVQCCFGDYAPKPMEYLEEVFSIVKV